MQSYLEKEYFKPYLILLITHDLVTLSNSMINPLLSLYAKQIGASGAYIGFIVASYSISRIILEIPSGYISHRFGYYIPLSFGLFLSAIGYFLAAFSSHPFHLILTRMLIGLGSPLFFTVSLGFIVQLFDLNRRGKAMGLFKSLQNIAAIIGSIAGGYIISALGFRMSFIISSFLIFIALLLLVVPSTIKNYSVKDKNYKFSFSSMRVIFKNTNILILCSATLAMFIMSSGIESTIFPIYAYEQLNFSYTQIGLFRGARSLGFVISLVSMGTLSDKMGRRPVLLLGLGSSAILIFILNFAKSFYLVAGIFFLIGLSIGAFWIIAPLVAAESLSSSLRGIAIGTYKTFFDLGSIIGPILMSVLLEISGYTICFYLASILIVINLIPSLKLSLKK